jgi:CheY-like chemotaxis protein
MNILLVDDNDDVREITALLLRDGGYNVLEASSGSAALHLLDANHAIDLLVVDFAMPKMSGTELIERVRATHPELRSVLITGYDYHPQINKILANEMVIRKPFTADPLVFAVRRASGQSEE